MADSLPCCCNRTFNFLHKHYCMSASCMNTVERVKESISTGMVSLFSNKDTNPQNNLNSTTTHEWLSFSYLRTTHWCFHFYSCKYRRWLYRWPSISVWCQTRENAVNFIMHEKIPEAQAATFDRSERTTEHSSAFCLSLSLWMAPWKILDSLSLSVSLGTFPPLELFHSF